MLRALHVQDAVDYINKGFVSSRGSIVSAVDDVVFLLCDEDKALCLFCIANEFVGHKHAVF